MTGPNGMTRMPGAGDWQRIILKDEED